LCGRRTYYRPLSAAHARPSRSSLFLRDNHPTSLPKRGVWRVSVFILPGMKPFLGEMVPAAGTIHQYKLSVIGKHQDPLFQQYARAVEHLAETKENISCQVEAYFETQFEQRLSQVKRQLGGAFVQAKPSASLVWGECEDGTCLFFKDAQKFFDWCFKRFKYEDSTNRAFYKRMGNKAHRAAMDATGRSYVNVSFQVGRDPPEKVTFELFDEECPETCKIFRNMLDDPKFHESLIHRIKDGAWIQGGDLVDGSGANSAFKADIRDESFFFKHDRAGMIGMANRGYVDTGGSQFYITVKELPYLDGMFVLFGRVVSGMRTILRIARLRCENERPIIEVRCSSTPDQLEVAEQRPVIDLKGQKEQKLKEEQEERDAATKVQSLYRGKRDKQRVQEKREEKQAATKVQSMYRGKRDKKRVDEIREQKKSGKISYTNVDDLRA